MLVLNTNSNTASVSAPKACPSITVPSSKTKVANFIKRRLQGTANIEAANSADYSTIVQTNSLNDRSIPHQRIRYRILDSPIRNDDATHATFQRFLRAKNFLLHATLCR